MKFLFSRCDLCWAVFMRREDEPMPLHWTHASDGGVIGPSELVEAEREVDALLQGDAAPPASFELVRGVTGRVYGAAEVGRLRWWYNDLIVHHGSLEGAIRAIAAMLDVPTLHTKEGLQPGVAGMLVDAANRLGRLS